MSGQWSEKSIKADDLARLLMKTPEARVYLDMGDDLHVITGIDPLAAKLGGGAIVVLNHTEEEIN